MTLRRQLAIVLRRLPLLVAGVVLIAVPAYLVARNQSPAFEASSVLLVGPSITDPVANDNALLVPRYLSQLYVQAATSPAILTAVIEELGLTTTPDALADQISVTSEQTPPLITIHAKASESKEAVDVANAVAHQLQAAAAEPGLAAGTMRQQLEAQRARMLNDITATLEQIDRLEATASPSPEQAAAMTGLQESLAAQVTRYQAIAGLVPTNVANQVTVLKEAAEPAAQIAPRALYYTMLAALVGLLAATAVAAALEYLDHRMRDLTDVAEATTLPTLGFVVRGRRGNSSRHRLAVLLDPRSKTAEAYRSIRTKVELSMADVGIRTLLISGSDVTEGNAATAINLAATFAQAGRRVVLVEADLRRPEISSLLGLPASPGLSGLLRSDRIELDDFLRSTKVENLFVLPSGPLPLDPAALLGSERMHQLLVDLKSKADLVVLNAPPLNVSDDAILLSTAADATVIVVDMAKGNSDALRAAEAGLRSARAVILGIVLHDVASRAVRGYEYHRQLSEDLTRPTRQVVQHGDAA